MKVFSKTLYSWTKDKKQQNICCILKRTYLSSQQISTALRPFYFFVHPDLFGQYPSERAINENSLQKLSSFIEAIKCNKYPSETNLTFYLKPTQNGILTDNDRLKSVNIKLRERTVEKTVLSILSSCNLPTTYVDSLPKPERPKRFNIEYDGVMGDYNSEYKGSRVGEILANETLSSWLRKNVPTARERLESCKAVREEVERLRCEISESLGLKHMILDCGWNTRHYRGCLSSFKALVHHHPKEMQVLRGRTVVFGRDTGVSSDGHILLNSSEVRHNWLDFITNIPKADATLITLPVFEKTVSRVLRDIKVVRRKFQPKIMAKIYENNLRRLTTSLSDYQGTYGYPKSWPSFLNEYELVVDNEAGPLMVSPTGQFIVPASCPPSHLVNFITTHLQEAKTLNEHYQSHKHVEKDLVKRCLDELLIDGLQKDDSIAPDLMISCCSRLLHEKEQLRVMLFHTRLYVASYYAVMSDGEICIPWNWKT